MQRLLVADRERRPQAPRPSLKDRLDRLGLSGEPARRAKQEAGVGAEPGVEVAIGRPGDPGEVARPVEEVEDDLQYSYNPYYYGGYYGFGNYFVGSLSTAIYRSTIDSPLTPSTGSMYMAGIKVAGGPFGGEIKLIKPQFESERGEVGRGGIVRDPEVRRRAVERIVGRCLRAAGPLPPATGAVAPGPRLLRHAFAAHLLAAGADPGAVRQLLGHAVALVPATSAAPAVEDLVAVYRRTHPHSGWGDEPLPAGPDGGPSPDQAG